MCENGDGTVWRDGLCESLMMLEAGIVFGRQLMMECVRIVMT